MHKLVLREAVDEQANGQPDRAEHGAVQTRLGVHNSVRIRSEPVVSAHLEVMRTPSQGGAEGEGNVGKACNALGPAALVGKGDGDDGQEQERDGPAKGDPQSKSHDDRLGEEHLDRLDRTGFQHGLEIGRVNVALGDVALIAGGLAQLHRAPVQRDTAAGLGEEEEDGDEQRHVGDALDAFDPAPPDGLVDEAGVNGRGDSAKDGNPREHGHGTRAILRHVHVVKRAANEDGADAAKDTEEQSQADNGADGLSEGEADEEKVEAEEGAGVDDFSTNEFAEGCEDHGCESAGEVEGKETHLAEFGRRVEVFYHAGDTRAVCGGGEADEKGHEVEHGCNTSLLPLAPLVGVLLVARREGEDDIFFLVVYNSFRQGERHVDTLNGLDRATICVNGLIRHIDIFSTHNAPDQWLALLVALDFVLMAHHREDIWCCLF